MRQVVSLIKDNQAHFALVDDESGDMIPFADLLIPDPDRFGLHETAVLGTNLINVLGLNGHKRPKVKIPRVGEMVPGPSPDEAIELERAEQPALPAPKPGGRRSKDGRQQARPDLRVKRFISREEVVDVINAHPEGITARQVAVIIDGKDKPDRWVIRTVENRIQHLIIGHREGTVEVLPFRTAQVPVEGQKRTARIVYPLDAD